MKLKVVEIRKGEIQESANKYQWTKHAIAVIEKISSAWLENNIAESVLLFFKEDISGDLHSYMPLVSDKRKSVPAAKDIKGAKNEDAIIGVKPYPISIKNPHDPLRKDDTDIIIRIMKQNFWNGNEVFRMSDEGNYQELDVSDVPSWETIGYGRRKIIDTKKRTGKTPTHIVHAVELMEREYNEATGYAECQMESHSINIKLDEIVNKGRFLAKDLIRLLEHHFELFQLLFPGENRPLTILLAGFLPGSSCIIGDYVVSPEADESIKREEIKEKVAEVEKRMSTVVQAAPVLVDKSKPPAERINEFKKETGLSNEEAYAAIHQLSKLRASRQKVELYAKDPENLEKTHPSITLDGTANTQFAEIKRNLAVIIEPKNDRNLTGKIVELDHYKDDDLKFGIYVEDEVHTYTIHYQKKEDQKVRERKGEIVTVSVLRDGPNKPWYFSKWLR